MLRELLRHRRFTNVVFTSNCLFESLFNYTLETSSEWAISSERRGKLLLNILSAALNNIFSQLYKFPLARKEVCKKTRIKRKEFIALIKNQFSFNEGHEYIICFFPQTRAQSGDEEKRIRNLEFLEVAEKVMRWEIKMAEEATPLINMNYTLKSEEPRT